MRRKVKFEIQIQGFSVKFEGDEDQAQTAVIQVGQGLAGLASLPGQMLHTNGSDSSAKQIAGLASAQDGAEGSGALEGTKAEKAVKAPRARSPKGESPQTLIENLVNEGYFSQERSAEDIVKELSKKGFTYGSGAISTPLTRLTRKNIILRDKKDGKHFLYKKAEGT